MRIASGPLARTVLAALVAWSAGGMQVDLASGPLTPEALLGEICDLAFRTDDGPEPVGSVSLLPMTPIALPGGDVAPDDSPPVVTEAAWPNAAFTHFPARVLVKRFVAARPAFTGLVPTHASLPEVPRVVARDDAALPYRLCRLHC